MYVSVHDEMPSPCAGLLRYARLKAGLSQSELAERAGVARTMVSAYEHDRRQATLPTLMRKRPPFLWPIPGLASPPTSRNTWEPDSSDPPRLNVNQSPGPGLG